MSRAKIANDGIQRLDMCGPAPYGVPLTYGASIIVVAIFVIAGMGMAGRISPSTTGWVMTGISGGLATMAILGMINNSRAKQVKTHSEKQVKIRSEKDALTGVILAVALLTLSILTACKVMSPKALGWCIFGPPIAGVAIIIIALCCKHQASKKETASILRPFTF